ncbi:MAG: FMN-binding glutamate synthase family protein [Planctomycetes bacterium]|nr:FMN-binding glutamate synthase family protein [Planctomycetota bacterium]
MKHAFAIDLERVSRAANIGIVLLAAVFGVAGYFVSFYFHFLTVAFFMLVVLNLFWRHFQTSHTLLSNFGFLAQTRYLVESVGPEFRQYLFASDTEEKPFSRVERAEVYRKAKGIDSATAFGSLLEFDQTEIKLRHSFYPVDKNQLQPFDIAVGASRNLATTYHIKRPIMISAMSYGALGQNAVRALARGAKTAGALMNTGEGGTPKYHLMEGCDLIFQLGTAKFGVRTEDGHLDDTKLAAISALKQVKLIEIKLSQGAKPGKGGLLPKEKITDEIAELRGGSNDKDGIAPAHHVECTDAKSTVAFIGRIQKVSGLPTGIKFCLGRPDELEELVQEMKRQSILPDFITVDGAEGGTGAAPKSFIDDVGLPIFEALPLVNRILIQAGIRDQLVIFASGKLINPGKQITALSMGADAIYSARGFLLALGCIQALQCNRNTCPVGITTHLKHLQNGLDIEEKAKRVSNYIEALHHDHVELLAAMGKKSTRLLSEDNVYSPSRNHPTSAKQEAS